jgi:glucose-6-phosphate dehydrogenase assembly protein OpcA
MPPAVRPEKILKDLAKLWVDLAKEETAGVLRACAMTLIVAVEEREHAQAVGETIAELMHEHPSRAIVLHVVRDGASEGLDARVFAQCWMPFGKRQQICCEEIEITAPEALLADVPKLLLGLTVPDLPVVLWVRSPRLAMHPEFQKIFPLASKIVVDSDSFEDGITAYEFVAGMNRRGANVADLAWTRMTGLRQMVAQIFDDERYRPYLEKIETVTISRTSERVGTHYLARWFRKALPVAAVRFRAGTGSTSVTGVDLAGADFSASVSLDGGCGLLRMKELTQRTALPPSTEHALLREELSIVGVDPTFQRCLE